MVTSWCCQNGQRAYIWLQQADRELSKLFCKTDMYFLRFTTASRSFLWQMNWSCINMVTLKFKCCKNVLKTFLKTVIQRSRVDKITKNQHLLNVTENVEKTFQNNVTNTVYSTLSRWQNYQKYTFLKHFNKNVKITLQKRLKKRWRNV